MSWFWEFGPEGVVGTGGYTIAPCGGVEAEEPI